MTEICTYFFAIAKFEKLQSERRKMFFQNRKTPFKLTFDYNWFYVLLDPTQKHMQNAKYIFFFLFQNFQIFPPSTIPNFFIFPTPIFNSKLELFFQNKTTNFSI